MARCTTPYRSSVFAFPYVRRPAGRASKSDFGAPAHVNSFDPGKPEDLSPIADENQVAHLHLEMVRYEAVVSVGFGRRVSVAGIATVLLSIGDAYQGPGARHLA